MTFVKSLADNFITFLRAKRSTTHTVALGFALIIIMGTFLLMLPVSSRTGVWTGFIEALFTATSATCVTGLVVADTYTHWSIFGKIVILCLIQIGGLGFITIGVYVSVILNRHIGLRQREDMYESVNALELAGMVRLAKGIVKWTFIFEGVGALLLAVRFIPEFGVVRGIFFSIFHSVSAFCNGGFDLMGIKAQYSSLVDYEGDVLVNLTICALILIGGLGFVVWRDIHRNELHVRKYMLHTKIVLIATVILTLGGQILFLLLEWDNTLAGFTLKEKLLGALFDAVTPRTAGFNTTDIAALTPASKLLTCVYMFIGGNPGSTAGGAKTTTVIVLLCYAVAMIRNYEDINIFNRRLTDDVVKKANAVFMINLTLATIAGVIIMFCHPGIPFEDVLLEVMSAINTVGMSSGITRELGTISRLVLIILMYCGRLGSLSFALVFAQKKTVDPVRKPPERIIVG